MSLRCKDNSYTFNQLTMLVIAVDEEVEKSKVSIDLSVKLLLTYLDYTLKPFYFEINELYICVYIYIHIYIIT